jgi:hypothetical protein
MVVALETDNLADTASRVRSEESETRAGRQRDWAGGENFAARQDQSICRMVSNVSHELAIDRIAGPAARRSWPR